jgi:Ca2+-binding RTX toxin-like protein
MSSDITGGTETRVNSWTTDDQGASSVAALDDGGWVVTWESNRDGWGYGIYQQRYDADGATVGVETRVNTDSAEDQKTPDITALANGGWVVSWTSQSGDADLGGICQQLYTADGLQVGSEILVNTYTVGSQYSEKSTALSDGGWVVTWTSNGEDGDQGGIYQQRYGGDGAIIGGEIQVNTYTTGGQYDPSVTALADGGWVVTWDSNEQTSSGYDIHQQRFAADGSTLGLESNVAQATRYTYDNHMPAQVAALSDGGWVVTWESHGGGHYYDIFQQRFSSDGLAVGSQTEVNSFTTSNQSIASVTGLADGGWVVTWMSDGQDDSNSEGIYQQCYAVDGSAVGAETRVNVYTTGDQQSPDVAPLSDGGWVVTWTSNNQDGSSGGIYQRRFGVSSAGDTQNNRLTGTNWDEYLIGYGGNDRLDGKGGNDVLIGGFGNDTYVVNSVGDQVEELPVEGKDTVLSAISFDLATTGSVENLTLMGAGKHNGFGNALDNRITGNSAANILRGRAGEDVIIGGKGNDQLYGGADADLFVFSKGDGKDVIADFNVVDAAHDVIDLSHNPGLSSFADVKAHHMSEHGTSVVISDGAGDTITIAHMTTGQLTAADFQF